MKRPMIASLPLLAACGTAALAEAPATTSQDLLGTWRTELSERQAPDGSQSAYLRQSAVFTAGTEEIRAEIFADPAGEVPIFTYASTGPYTVIGASSVVPGALDLELINDVSEVTLFMDVPELMAAVGLGDCDLVIGAPVEVSDCVSGPPFSVTDCVDLDLVAVDRDGARLRFGAEGVDRCETRPSELSESAFFKVN